MNIQFMSSDLRLQLSVSFPDHVELAELVEWPVIDRSLTIEVILQDLRRFPRSFFVLTEQPSLIKMCCLFGCQSFPALRCFLRSNRFTLTFGRENTFAERIYPVQVPKGRISIKSLRIGLSYFQCLRNSDRFCRRANLCRATISSTFFWRMSFMPRDLVRKSLLLLNHPPPVQAKTVVLPRIVVPQLPERPKVSGSVAVKGSAKKKTAAKPEKEVGETQMGRTVRRVRTTRTEKVESKEWKKTK
jgi:hypothetical protein